jgi:hypothetical protein
MTEEWDLINPEFALARLRVRVPGGSLEILGGRCVGEKGRRGGEGALPVGSLGQREGEGNGRCQDWAERAAPSWLSARERKRKEWAAGRGGKSERGKREREREIVGLRRGKSRPKGERGGTLGCLL